MEGKGGRQGPGLRAQIVAYTLTNIGTAFSWGYITSYFMMFCTDAVGISAAACSVLLLVSRLFDGFTDSVCGFWTDRRPTRWGRYRPWVLCCAPLVVICTSLLFFSGSHWPMWQKLVWAYGSYFLYLLAFTGFSVPLDSMASVMSGDPADRARIISWRSAAGIIGALLMTQIATWYFADHGTDQVESYFHLTLLFGCISLPLFLLTPLVCRERIQPRGERQRNFSLWEVARQNLGNRPFWITVAGHFLNGLITYGRVSIFVYYFKYVAGDLALYATFTLLMRVPQIFGAWVGQHFLKLFKTPGRALAVLYLAYGLTLTANFFVSPAQDLAAFWALTVVSSFLFGMSYALIYIIIPDLVDYGEYLSGVRNDGGISATLDFANKVGMAIGTSGMGFVLAALGFSANMPQTPEVMLGINALMFLAPGLLSMGIGALFLGYKLDRTVLHAGE